MYFSRLRLDPRNRQVWRDLADCQQMHLTIMSAFPEVGGPDGSARARLAVLYHVDATNGDGPITVYVQSKVKPDWSHLRPGYLFEPSSDNPVCTSMYSYLGRLANGAQLIFRLRANPTKKIDTKTGPDGRRRNGKRVELWREQDLLAWLRRKAEQSGFEVISVSTRPDVPDSLAVAEPKAVGRVGAAKSSGVKGDGRTLTFGSVLFAGRLRVTDVDRFRSAIELGIGSGKAYGFGLLLTALARV